MAGIPTSATAIADQANQGLLSLAMVSAEAWEQAETWADNLNCFTTLSQPVLNAESARQADLVAESLARGQTLPLAGVPIVIKDNIVTSSMPTTCGSRYLEGFQSIYDATVITRLRAAGAIIMAKANMDEFGMGSTGENSAFGPVPNPWNRQHVAGGSSSGSAAAVAAGIAPLALGSDTGGSIRTPASFCGVVGFKPSYGAVSRYGLVAYASSLDHIGPIAGSVADVALVYDVLRGHDRRDATSRDLTPVLQHNAPLKIGIIPALHGTGLSVESQTQLKMNIENLRERGCLFQEFILPEKQLLIAAYYIIACAEASANLARYDGIRYGQRAKDAKSLGELYAKSRSEGLGAEVKQRILMGTYVLSAGHYEAYYQQALRLRQRIRQWAAACFREVDLLLVPSFATTAPILGAGGGDAIASYMSDIYTVLPNLAGIPALSLPVGLDQNGLPQSLQLWAADGADLSLLASAARIEGWLEKMPKIARVPHVTL